MQFKFKPRRPARNRHAEALTFTVEKLWIQEAGAESDLSHLLDRSYGYQSERELLWHLAERFDLPVSAVSLTRA